MASPRPLAAAAAALSVCALWAVPGQHLMGKLYNGMQAWAFMLGVRDSKVIPLWYDWASIAIATTLGLAPGLIAAILISRRMSGCSAARKAHPAERLRTPGAAVRLPAAILCAGVCSVLIEHFAGELLLDGAHSLARTLGATTRIIGYPPFGPDGPFMGDRWIDGVGNILYRYGPGGACSLLGGAIALAVYARFDRRDLRRIAATSHLCPACGYDIRGSRPESACAECGHLAKSV